MFEPSKRPRLIRYIISSRSPFRHVMKAWCLKHGVGAELVRFILEDTGMEILTHYTPLSLGKFRIDLNPVKIEALSSDYYKPDLGLLVPVSRC